jgi:hypothetical protein
VIGPPQQIGRRRPFFLGVEADRRLPDQVAAARRQSAATAVVARRLLSFLLLLPHLFQALGGTEAGVGVPRLDQR